MTREEVVRITNEFLVDELEIDPGKISDDARLKEELGIDSLDFVDIVVIVESHFGFKIRQEDIKNVKTLSQFYDYILNNVR